MRIFISAGEPSGDIHGANLIRAMTRLRSDVECVGFGGDRMAQAGCRLHFALADHAVMGLSRVLASLPTYMSWISQADRYFRHARPDAVVLIDCPGFNWWLARRAHFHRIPVFYFVPPQIWAWASWRVSKMRRFVDQVLCSLPFEEAWYRERGVPATYVGHPFFDELPRQQLDDGFLAKQRQTSDTIIGILPGSRTQEVEWNLRSQLRAARTIHQARPETRFLIASFKRSQQARAEQMCREFPDLPVRTFVGKTPEIMELSKACIAVSGSVSLELLYRARPTAIVYRLGRIMARLIRPLISARYVTLVNLLADRELFPEFTGDQCPAPGTAEAILRWLQDESAYAETLRGLLELREKVARPGACARAAERILAGVGQALQRAG